MKQKSRIIFWVLFWTLILAFAFLCVYNGEYLWARADQFIGSNNHVPGARLYRLSTLSQGAYYAVLGALWLMGGLLLIQKSPEGKNQMPAVYLLLGFYGGYFLLSWLPFELISFTDQLMPLNMGLFFGYAYLLPVVFALLLFRLRPCSARGEHKKWGRALFIPLALVCGALALEHVSLLFRPVSTKSLINKAAGVIVSFIAGAARVVCDIVTTFWRQVVVFGRDNAFPTALLFLACVYLLCASLKQVFLRKDR